GGFWGGSSPSIPDSTSDVMTQAAMDELKTNNPLFQYAPNVPVNECPGDTRFKAGSKATGWSYGSYSKTQNVGGEPVGAGGNFFALGDVSRKFSAIRPPAQPFMMIEDAGSTGTGGGSAGYNIGTWVQAWTAGTANFTWTDPVPMFHGNVSTAG